MIITNMKDLFKCVQWQYHDVYHRSIELVMSTARAMAWEVDMDSCVIIVRWQGLPICIHCVPESSSFCHNSRLRNGIQSFKAIFIIAVTALVFLAKDNARSICKTTLFLCVSLWALPVTECKNWRVKHSDEWGLWHKELDVKRSF